MEYKVEKGTYIILASSHRHSEPDGPATTVREQKIASAIFTLAIFLTRERKGKRQRLMQSHCLLLLVKMPGRMGKEHLEAGESSQESQKRLGIWKGHPGHNSTHKADLKELYLLRPCPRP